MFRSATVKLTVWYLALVMAISLMFSVVVYRVGTREIASGLSRQTQRIYHDFPVFQDSPELRPGDDLSASNRHLLVRLAAFNAVVLMGAGLASYYLARRTLRPIEAAHARQTRFTADASHELRTPLTAIKMESEVTLMDKASGKPALRAALKSNIEEADKLDALVNNLLRLSRLEDAELRTGFSRLQTQPLTEAALAQIQKAAGTKHITITRDIKDVAVSGDHDSLVQLLVILLDNAIKYSPANSGIQVSSRQEGNQVQLQVRDEGIGIEPSALDHVFDRFYRADSSRGKTGTDGFGLGLSIAKLIADLHDGTITLSSRRGRGTTATLSLPVAK